MRKLISLFTGAGGLDLGFEAAGYSTVAAVEMDREAVATLRHNRDWPVFDRDVHTVTSGELRAAGHLGEGDADALIGGPPCQPFSKAGYWAKGDSLRLGDPRAGTLGAYGYCATPCRAPSCSRTFRGSPTGVRVKASL